MVQVKVRKIRIHTVKINQFFIVLSVIVSMLFSSRYFFELKFDSLLLKNILTVSLMFLAYLITQKRRIKFFKLTVNICAIYFGILLIVVTTFQSLGVILSVLNYFLWILFAYVFILSVLIKMDLNDIYLLAKRLINCSLFLIILMSLLAICEGDGIFTHQNRLSGPFSNPLNFASFIFFIYSLLFLFSTNYSRFLFFLLSILLLCALALSQSRTYFLVALVLFISDYIFLRFRWVSLKFYVFGVVLFPLVILLSIFFLTLSEIYFNLMDAVLSGRISLWVDVLSKFNDRNSTGFDILFGDSNINSGATGRISLDNTFLDITFSAGIIGLLLYLYLSGTTAVFLYRNIVKNREDGARAFMIFISVFLTGFTYAGSAYLANLVSLFIVPMCIAVSFKISRKY